MHVVLVSNGKAGIHIVPLPKTYCSTTSKHDLLQVGTQSTMCYLRGLILGHVGGTDCLLDPPFLTSCVCSYFQRNSTECEKPQPDTCDCVTLSAC